MKCNICDKKIDCCTMEKCSNTCVCCSRKIDGGEGRWIEKLSSGFKNHWCVICFASSNLIKGIPDNFSYLECYGGSEYKRNRD
jgi:hypothetical protein